MGLLRLMISYSCTTKYANDSNDQDYKRDIEKARERISKKNK